MGEDTSVSSQGLLKRALSRFLMAVFILGAAFFLPAGTLLYWQAWVYMVILFVPMALFLRYLLKHDPELLDRRLRMREREAQQKRVIAISIP
ncbi:MAG: isoprenylcysteine carboxylmethyltransferase family protein, partial [Chloroflexi bacterium]|nr:isoprenylcysteine carboxylmethyltransferase family protein [Chloroflexota bacterium]